MKKLLPILIFLSAATASSNEVNECKRPEPPAFPGPNKLGVPCRFERRAAFDVGSGSLKLAIADVKICGGKVEETVKVAVDKEYKSQPLDLLRGVPCGAENYPLDPAQQRVAAETLVSMKVYAECMGAVPYVGVATQAIRGANKKSRDEFLALLKQKSGLDFTVEPEKPGAQNPPATGFQVVQQDTEGRLGFQGAMREFLKPCAPDGSDKECVPKRPSICRPDNSVVWDIGGGSAQVVRMDKKKGLQVEKLKIGSNCFQQRLLTRQQLARNAREKKAGIPESPPVKNPQCAAQGVSPNPIGDAKEVDDVMNVFHKMIEDKGGRRFAKFVKKYRDKDKRCIIGIGGVHNFAVYESIRKHWDKTACAGEPLSPEGTFTQHQVLCLAKYLATRKDSDPELCSDPFSPTNVSNLILMAAFLDHFDVEPKDEIQVADVNMTNELFFDSKLHPAPLAAAASGAPPVSADKSATSN